MIKHVELNEKLENYILEHSNEFNPILKEIIDYNQTLGDKKKTSNIYFSSTTFTDNN